MRKRITDTNFANKRLLSEIECQQYIGLGRTNCRKYCEEIQAIKHIGRRILYDRHVIDAYLDAMKQ